MLLIPVAAFALGVGAAVMTASSQDDPYCGVYRQETVEVAATLSGRVMAITAGHGNVVRPGDLLLTLENVNIADRSQKLAAQQESLRERLQEATAKANIQIALQIERLEKERLEIRLRYADLLRDRFDVQVRKKALQQEVANDSAIAREQSGIIQPVSVETRTASRRVEFSEVVNREEVLNTQVALCEERLAKLESLRNDIPTQIENSLGIDRLRSDLAETETRLALVENEKTTSEIVCPTYGRVGVYHREVNEYVTAGETLVEVFDAERPYILLTVSVSAQKDFSTGREVRVEFEGLETRKPLSGVISQVLSEAERNPDAAMRPGTTVAQIYVKPTGRLWPTPPLGTTARVYLD